jgi:branched-chain amino acid aminotransferase
MAASEGTRPANPPAGTAVWIDGRVVGPAEATVSVFDHGLTVGDGVFETAKVVDGQAFALRRHLDRLARSARGLGLDVPYVRSRMVAAVGEALDAAGPEAGRLRITLTGGPAPLGSGRGEAPPTLIIAVAPAAPWEPDTTAVTVPWPRNERSAVAGLKTTSYAENVVALAEARKVGATEAILANTRGRLCEGTGTNVFVAVGGRLLTPSLLSGCLAGVTRDLVLESLPAADEDDLGMEVLDDADEVLLTSSTRDVQPLRMLDGRPLPGRDGPLARQAAAALAAVQAASLDP